MSGQQEEVKSLGDIEKEIIDKFYQAIEERQNNNIVASVKEAGAVSDFFQQRLIEYLVNNNHYFALVSLYDAGLNLNFKDNNEITLLSKKAKNVKIFDENAKTLITLMALGVPWSTQALKESRKKRKKTDSDEVVLRRDHKKSRELMQDQTRILSSALRTQRPFYETFRAFYDELFVNSIQQNGSRAFIKLVTFVPPVGGISGFRVNEDNPAKRSRVEYNDAADINMLHRPSIASEEHDRKLLKQLQITPEEARQYHRDIDSLYDYRSSVININTFRNVDGLSVLHLFAAKGNLAMVKALVEGTIEGLPKMDPALKTQEDPIPGTTKGETPAAFAYRHNIGNPNKEVSDTIDYLIGITKEKLVRTDTAMVADSKTATNFFKSNEQTVMHLLKRHNTDSKLSALIKQKFFQDRIAHFTEKNWQTLLADFEPTKQKDKPVLEFINEQLKIKMTSARQHTSSPSSKV